MLLSLVAASVFASNLEVHPDVNLRQAIYPSSNTKTLMAQKLPTITRNNVKFQLRGCEPDPNYTTCNFSIESNIDQSIYIYSDGTSSNNSRLIDVSGNEYRAYDTYLGSKRVINNFVGGVPISSKIIFSGSVKNDIRLIEINGEINNVRFQIRFKP